VSELAALKIVHEWEGYKPVVFTTFWSSFSGHRWYRAIWERNNAYIRWRHCERALLRPLCYMLKQTRQQPIRVAVRERGGRDDDLGGHWSLFCVVHPGRRRSMDDRPSRLLHCSTERLCPLLPAVPHTCIYACRLQPSRRILDKRAATSHRSCSSVLFCSFFASSPT